MSMAHSPEVRVPYLDPALAEWVARNISPENKLRGKVGKRILRSAFQRDLPPEIFRQKKAGFGAPIDYWLAEDLQEMIRDLLSEDRIQSRGLFKPESVAGLVQDQFSGRRDRSFQVWQLLTLELWFQNFIDA